MMFCLPAILDQIQLTDNNYCPLNNTGFYDIDYEIIFKETNSSYCPLDITGFYDFTNPPT